MVTPEIRAEREKDGDVMNNATRILVGAAVFALAASAQCAYEVCGPLENAYGPFDYRTEREHLAVVERYHFTPGVESLQGGNTASVGGDLDYTLRASPNHHRALLSMANLALRDKTHKPRGANFTIECYFDRAIRFAPTDGDVYMIYGTYLFRAGDKDIALKEFEVAEKLVGDNANLEYNLGLVYLDAKQYDRSLAHAQRAYALGFPLQGLKKKLIAAGKWRESPDAGPAVKAPTQN
jgi:tetratricopeptide (TPR) repeat protein